MSGQNDRGSTSMTYDDGDVEEPLYAYGRDFQKGPQQGFILSAFCKTWPDQNKSIDLTIGTGCPSLPGKGVKTDYRLRLPSPAWGEFLRAMGLAPKKGETIDLAALKNREVCATLGEEVNRRKSEEAGRNVMTAKCLSIGAPKAVQAPPAAQPKPPTAGGAFA